MVGHLRDEKDPRTYFAPRSALARRSDILLDHIGGALDPALGAEATALAARAARATAGSARLPHAATRRRIQAAHVLVHPSRMEGGAHVVIEAVRSGTPVLASRIDGNVGLLGADYAGYFAAGDDARAGGPAAARARRCRLCCRACSAVRAPRAAVRTRRANAPRCIDLMRRTADARPPRGDRR